MKLTFRAACMAVALSAALLPAGSFSLLPCTTARAEDAIPAEQKLKAGDLVAICGDSITARRVYSGYILAYLLTVAPQANLQAMQFGWGGERAPGFLARMENDTLRYHPTVATTCYGMNDGNYAETDTANVAKYKASMTDIVKKMKEGGVRFIIVGSPGTVDNAKYTKRKTTGEVYNKTLADLAAAAKEVAKEQGVTYADVNGVMADMMVKSKAKLGDKYTMPGGDSVHPGNNGHLVMAYAFLKAMGCDGNVGTITVDLKGANAEATPGQKVLSSTGAKTEIESTRYPFCFPEPADKNESAASILPVLPFQSELNRYMLIVKNPPADAKSLKVTWGTVSKTFPVTELAKGINLAEEFRDDNPFVKTYATILAAVLDQQNLENDSMRNVVTSMPSWEAFLKDDPSAKTSLENISTGITQRLVAKREASSKAVVPVKHTLLVEKAD